MRSSGALASLFKWLWARPFGSVHAQTVLIIPSDPWTLAGSIGDAAMITAVVEEIRAQAKDVEILVLTNGAIADEAASRLGVRGIRADWHSDRRFKSLMRRHIWPNNVSAVLIVGADVLDGGYGSWISKRLLSVAELAACRHIPTTILGFSFKGHPPEDLRTIWSSLNPAVQINLRDPRSLARFQSFSGREARLVADCAFLLKAVEGPTSRKVAAWADKKRAQGRRVLGINYHPQLFGAADDGFERLGEAFRQALAHLGDQDGMSFVLLPHDNRPDSDRAALQQLSDGLPGHLHEQVLLVDEQVGPGEIKAIAAKLDGVVTGRMHLAIASLGVGTPVVALTYKDKFEGLFDHFELSSWLLSSPEAASDPDHLIALIRKFGGSLEMLKLQIDTRLPGVRQAARRNVETLGLARKT